MIVIPEEVGEHGHTVEAAIAVPDVAVQGTEVAGIAVRNTAAVSTVVANTGAPSTASAGDEVAVIALIPILRLIALIPILLFPRHQGARRIVRYQHHPPIPQIQIL
jgi:hypothetical protein